VKIKALIPLILPLLAVAIIIFVVPPSGLTPEKIWGAALSAVLWALGYSSLRWGERQNQRVLLGILTGGILFRMLIVILSLFFVRSFTQLDLMSYVISLMVFYLACEFALVIDYALRR